MPPVLKETFRSFSQHGARVLSGAIAFYALLSVVPILAIAIRIAGALTNQEAARAALLHDLSRWVGADGARTIGTLLDRGEQLRHAALADVLGVLLLVYASTRLFSALVYALHHMWDVRARSGATLREKAEKQLRKRALAFLMVIVVGAMLVLLVVGKAVVAAATRHVPSAIAAATTIQVSETLGSLLIATGLFAAIFKVLPDVKLGTRDALLGAFVTALLFSLGASAIGLWIAHKGTTWGAAGSIVVLLLWVHYSAQIFFLGVAFTGVWARQRGRAIEPTERAVRVVIED